MSIPSGGDVSEQMVKVTLYGVEHTIKFLADMTPEVLALMKALLEKSTDPQIIAGKTRLVNLLKADPNLSSFTIKSSERKEFEKIADDLKIPFCSIKSRANPDECNILFHTESKARMNDVLEKFNYNVIDASPDKKKQTPPSVEHSYFSSNEEPTMNKAEVSTTMIKPTAGEQFKQIVQARHQVDQDYSPRNKELILKQKPDASLVMSKRKWKESGYTLKNDAKPLMIYLPRFDEKSRTPREFTKVPVYDIADMVGDPLIHRLPYKTEQECQALMTQIESKVDVSFQDRDRVPEPPQHELAKKQLEIPKELAKSEQLCLFFQSKANLLFKDNPNKDLLAMAVAYRISEKLNVDNTFLDFSRLDQTIKGMDKEEIKSILDEIDIGYKALSKEIDLQKGAPQIDLQKDEPKVDLQKDAPQINAPILKTEKER